MAGGRSPGTMDRPRPSQAERAAGSDSARYRNSTNAVHQHRCGAWYPFGVPWLSRWPCWQQARAQQQPIPMDNGHAESTPRLRLVLGWHHYAETPKMAFQAGTRFPDIRMANQLSTKRTLTSCYQSAAVGGKQTFAAPHRRFRPTGRCRVGCSCRSGPGRSPSL